MLDHLLSIVAPHLCTNCGQLGTLLCDNCKYDIVSEPYERCLHCQKPSLDGVCKSHHLAYRQAWCVGERQGAVQRLIGTFKFQNAQAAYRPLAQLLHARLPDLPLDTVIVPVPSLPDHIRERGYDHVQLICRELGRLRGLTISRCIERRDKSVQHHANREQRIQQAVQAFHIARTIDPAVPYLIIDDVVTTGSTIKQMARILRDAGAVDIWVAVIARQPLD